MGILSYCTEFWSHHIYQSDLRFKHMSHFVKKAIYIYTHDRQSVYDITVARVGCFWAGDELTDEWMLFIWWVDLINYLTCWHLLLEIFRSGWHVAALWHCRTFCLDIYGRFRHSIWGKPLKGTPLCRTALSSLPRLTSLHVHGAFAMGNAPWHSHSLEAFWLWQGRPKIFAQRKQWEPNISHSSFWGRHFLGDVDDDEMSGHCFTCDANHSVPAESSETPAALMNMISTWICEFCIHVTISLEDSWRIVG